jgi:hypothetical protein
MLNQRLSSMERNAQALRLERDKLIGISGDLKAQILTFEKQRELQSQKEKLNEFKKA